MRSRIGAIMTIAVSLMLTVVVGPAHADQMLSKPQFRDRFIAEIHKIAPRMTVKIVSDQQLELSQPGSETADSYLNNAYANYLKDPAALDELVAGYAKVAIQSTASMKSIRLEDLVILIRPTSYNTAGNKEKVVRPLAADLVRMIAINTPDSFQIPTLEQISRALGVPDDKLWSRALENTKVLIGECSATKLSEGVTDLACNRGFASSALLLDELWVPHKIPGRGAAVVAVGKNDLLVAHNGAPKSVEALSGFLATRGGDPDFLSSSLLVRTADGWATYAPNP